MKSAGFNPRQPANTMTLIAENCDGYQPMGEVFSFAEAKEIADSYMKTADRENDFCPESFAVWGRNKDGAFVVIERFET